MSQPGRDRPAHRVLVTGAGGPAAIAAMRSLRSDHTIELLAADMDPWAAGLYLVPPGAAALIPAGAAPGFADSLLATCVALGVDIVLPTVDAELRPLAAAREKFAAAGIGVLLAPAGALDIILDKLSLAATARASSRSRAPNPSAPPSIPIPGPIPWWSSPARGAGLAAS